MKKTTLELSYYTENGKIKNLSISKPKPGLTEAEIREAMQAISDAKMFESDGVLLYEEIRSARYVTTAVEEVFEVE